MEHDLNGSAGEELFEGSDQVEVERVNRVLDEAECEGADEEIKGGRV